MNDTIPSQRRYFHTGILPRGDRPIQRLSFPKQQRRTLHLTGDTAKALLRDYGIEISTKQATSQSSLIGISIHRSARSPCIIVSSASSTVQPFKIPFSFLDGPQELHIHTTFNHLNLPSSTHKAIHELIAKIWALFLDRDAITIVVHAAVSESSPASPIISSPSLQFDDAAFRVGKRHSDLHALRDTSTYTPAELAAEPHGIIYVELGDQTHNVGTLVNGAGLAMNTVDALAARGVLATNFCDTGGLATSATVATGFGLLLADPRVKVIFVNIFGGLTLGDMIARGILMAFREKDVTVPVVVRIRGTNEKEGQKIIAESGLPLYAYDDFEEAAMKIKELVEKTSKGTV
jgi:succinyl-CoA synthetase alpha subunit